MVEQPTGREHMTAKTDDDRRQAVLGWLRGLVAAGALPAEHPGGVDRAVLERWTSEYLATKLPVPPGTVEELTGSVGARVTIRRDSWGISHVVAESEPDLFFGLGYAMAQDRLWQLDYQRRLVRGELAAVLGPRALASDRVNRILGLAEAGDRAWETAVPAEREVLAALAAGINRWIEQVGSRLPVEFEILGYEPRPWHPSDSIALWKHRWWTLTGRLDLILLAEAGRLHLPAELADALSHVELEDETIVPLADRLESPGHGGGSLDEGSNNWVASGRLTTTGAPVVCSDPHNPFSAPSQWFEAQLTCPSFDAAGAVYLGTPVLYLGRNQHVAWGVTNHAISVRDLYREETSPDQPGRYRDGERWRDFQIERQTIAVAGGPSDTLEIRRTVRGPVVNELLPPLTEPITSDPITLRWLGAEVPSGFAATLALLRARSAADLLEALHQWPCPPLNFVYADRSGSFGYHAAGLVPRRGRPENGIRQANDPNDAWRGFVPFDELPRVANPARGWVATANNVPWSRDPAYLASGAWSDGYRARRIRERLTARAPLHPDDLAAIHGDVENGRARDLVPTLLPVIEPGSTLTARLAIQALRDWDDQMTIDSVGATIWTAFWAEWTTALARVYFPEALVEAAAQRLGNVGRRLLLGEALPWFRSTSVSEEIHAAFERAVAALSAEAGPDVQAWRWGSVHQVSHPHPLGTTPELSAIFSTGPYPTSGGMSVVRAAGHGWKVPFAVTSGSTYRFVADLSRPDTLRSVQTLGQSAQPGSPHYRDQTPLWLANDYHPLWMSPDDVQAHLESEVVIRPA